MMKNLKIVELNKHGILLTQKIKKYTGPLPNFKMMIKSKSYQMLA